MTKTGIRPKKGQTVVIVESGKAREEVVTKSGTKLFYARENWRQVKFAMGCCEGARQEGFRHESCFVFSSTQAQADAAERHHLLLRLRDKTHNCNAYGDLKDRCPTDNIRKALALLEASECEP